jgi:hypothetical protein
MHLTAFRKRVQTENARGKTGLFIQLSYIRIMSARAMPIQACPGAGGTHGYPARAEVMPKLHAILDPAASH